MSDTGYRGLGGTVTTSAPATGDGSAGSPVSVAAATTSAPGSMSIADKTKVDGVRAYTDFEARMKRLCYDNYPTLNTFYHDDFLGAKAWRASTGTSGGVAVSGAAVTGGLLNMDCAAGSSQFVVAMAGSTESQFLVNNIKTGSWFIAMRAILPTGSVDSTTILAVAFDNGSAQVPQGLGIWGATSTTLLTKNVNGVHTATATAIPTVSNFFELAMGSDGATITYFLNGVVVATTPDLSSVSTLPGHVAVYFANGANMAHLGAQVDKWFGAVAA